MADAIVTPKDQAAQGRRTALLGSLFLMATSAIGPGFITQTGQFTYTLGAAFAFAILTAQAGSNERSLLQHRRRLIARTLRSSTVRRLWRAFLE